MTLQGPIHLMPSPQAAGGWSRDWSRDVAPVPRHSAEALDEGQGQSSPPLAVSHEGGGASDLHHAPPPKLPPARTLLLPPTAVRLTSHLWTSLANAVPHTTTHASDVPCSLRPAFRARVLEGEEQLEQEDRWDPFDRSHGHHGCRVYVSGEAGSGGARDATGFRFG